MPNIKLVPRQDGEYDILIEYSKADVEFAWEFGKRKNKHTNSEGILKSISEYAKKAKIKSVKIFASGILVASLSLTSFLSVFAASDRYIMGYLYSGTDHQQIEYVNQTGQTLDTVSPSYFNIQEDGSLTLNYVSTYLIDSMHAKGIKVVPFLSNHWDRTAGINALKDVETLSTQIADDIEEYNLDGVNVDIENVTHEQRDQYTQLVKLLREKIPSHKEVSVAVAANPNDWQTGWHGSYDYSALAQYADHLFIMTYDEHYEGGAAGPVAGIQFVEDSIQYALSKTTADKIVIGVPLYGRVWSLDDNRIVGKGISSKTIQDILNNCESTVTYDETSQSVKAEFTITEQSTRYTVGGDFVLQPGKYVVWYENDQSYEAKLGLVEKYNLKGAGSWALGQEDPSIWDHYEEWVNGETEDTASSEPSIPNQPEQPDTSEPVIPQPPNPPSPSEPEPPESIVPPETNLPESSPSEPEESEPPISSDTPESSEPPTTEQPDSSNPTEPESPERPVTPEPESPESPVPSEPQQPDSSIPSVPQNPTPPNTESPSETPPTSPESNYLIHQVISGDTLWGIAEKYLGSGFRYHEIMQLNGLTSTLIYPGDQIKLPIQYQEYTVQTGDSLWKIAQEQLGSGTRYTEIMQLNHLSSDVIYPGQIFKLPIV